MSRSSEHHIELAITDFHIAKGEEEVRYQVALVQDCRRGGYDTTKAELLLHILREALAGWYSQRAQILAALER